ncbi:hypothetical protein BS47DRAFT_1379942 [Hydnum rufescens UP504]|uniref:Uncharacterized protein n=1 Tax=Hydnum rufescens UP504 TaxID=1448309 RepID=A0A9P6B639_9AGAM|nr:hypothetical protein BS47DRAFT_1379942 [Hydnum rufescens UP504]
MTVFANAGLEGTITADQGHHFICSASFPWNDPVNGPRVQTSGITVALQSKALGRHKEITLEGSIKLNAHGHTTAERFKLDSFEIKVLALHGKSGSDPHPIQCNYMSPVSGREYAPTTEETRTSTFTMAPSASSAGQIQCTNSTRRTRLGTPIRADPQSTDPFTTGTVWFQRVEDPAQRTFGGFLGSFSARFVSCCSEHAGCLAGDPTSLSITINADLTDSAFDASSKALIQTVCIQYPDWPTLDDNFAGESIHTVYNTNFRGPEVEVITTARDVANTNKLPDGILYTMEVNRARHSGFGGHRATSKMVGTVNTIGRTLKVIGKQIRRLSKVLDDHSAQSGSNT